MTKTLYDPEVEQRGIETGIEKRTIEIAKKMLLKGNPLEEIQELTDLDEKTINELRKTI